MSTYPAMKAKHLRCRADTRRGRCHTRHMSTTTSLHTGRKAPRPGSRSVGAHVVRVHVHEEDGCWWAETPDYPGLTITEASKDALLDAIRPAVEFHLHESDVDLTAGIRLAISLPSSGLGLA